MADGISAAAGVQLSVLNMPELAREQVPVAQQAALANAQVRAIVDKADEEADETVQRLDEGHWRGVSNSLSGHPNGQPRAYREPVRAPRLRERAIPLAAAYPYGMGQMVDVSA